MVPILGVGTRSAVENIPQGGLKKTAMEWTKERTTVVPESNAKICEVTNTAIEDIKLDKFQF